MPSIAIDGLKLVRIPSNFLMSFDYRVKVFLKMTINNDKDQL